MSSAADEALKRIVDKLSGAVGKEREMAAAWATQDSVVGGDLCYGFVLELGRGTPGLVASGLRFLLVTTDKPSREVLIVAGVQSSLVVLLHASVTPVDVVANPVVRLFQNAKPTIDWNVYVVGSFNTKAVRASAVKAFLFALNGGFASPFMFEGIFQTGIGKTSMMLCGCCDFVDLVVYVNIGDAVGHSGDGLEKLEQLGRTMDKRGSAYIDLRNETMMGVAVMLVEFAVGPDLHASLCHSKERFNVRLVFDETVRMHEFVPGLCAAGGLRIRERLKWSERVIVHTVAGGTGVGSADNHLGSGLERYYMTALEPNRHLWDEMEAAVMSAVRARGVDAFSQQLEKLLARIKSDHFCDSACGNPRLAALMVIRCWNVALLVVRDNPFIDASNDVRRHVLLPAAKTFKSLCGLRRMFDSKEFRDTLVSALSHTLHPDFHDTRLDLGAECLVSRRGVLMDNSYFKVVSGEKQGVTFILSWKPPNPHEMARPLVQPKLNRRICSPSCGKQLLAPRGLR